jgi:hypothetical protein
MGRVGELAFFAAFFVGGLIGLALVLGFVVIPELRSAHEFVETVCVVKSKRIGESQHIVHVELPNPSATEEEPEEPEGSESESELAYRPEIRIEYEVDGRKYSTWTYDIAGVYSSDHAAQQVILDRFEIGKEYPCWYDPQDHKTAVLVRGFSWFGPLIALIPLSLLLIGGGGLLYGLFHLGKSAEHRAAVALRNQRRRERILRKSGLTPDGLGLENLPSVPRGVHIANSPGNTFPFRLPVSVLPAWKLLGLLAACLIWNGIVAICMTIVVQSFIDGQPKWAMGLFTLPFLACGVFLIWLLVKQFLISTSVGVTFVEMSSHPLMPGESYQFLLHQAGRLRVARLEMNLVCREKTQYQQGTDTRTESQVVFEQVLFSKKRFEINHGKPFEVQESFEVPEGVMHSFTADSNEVSWSIEVRGRVARWPAFTRTFPVVVHPPHGGDSPTIRLELSSTPAAHKPASRDLASMKRFG